MRLVIIGYGRMGRMIEGLALDAGHEIAARIDVDNISELETLDRADAALDFSASAALGAVSEYVKRTGTPLLSGVTTYTQDDLAAFDSLGEYAPVIHSANYSLGVAVLKRMLREASASLLTAGFDAEIAETHHNKKADAPSGTAKLLYEAMDPDHAYTPVYGREGVTGARGSREIGIHALRGGTVAGTHTVSFFGQDEEISITHRAASRAIFANGALHAAAKLASKPRGRYTLDELLF